MQKHILLFTVLCAALFSACEKTIDFKGDGTAPMIVVNGLVVPGKPVEVSVTKSQSLLAASYLLEVLTDAKVDLYVDGEFAETLDLVEVESSEYISHYFPDYSEWAFRGQTIAENGKTYRLEVAREGLQSVSCETTVPDEVELLAVDTATELIPVDHGTQELWAIKIKFNDNAENENFYRVQVDQITGVNKSYYLGEKESSDTIILGEQLALYLDLVDPVFGSTDEANEIVTGTPDNEYALFDDTQISGREYTVKVGLPHNYNPYDLYPSDEDSGNFRERKIVFYALSPEYYEYLKSAINHFYYADDYFSEPVPVYSNVRGGMGVFAALDSVSCSFISGTYPMEGKVYVKDYRYGGYGYGY